MSKIMFECRQLGSQTKQLGLKWELSICHPFGLLAGPSAPFTDWCTAVPKQPQHRALFIHGSEHTGSYIQGLEELMPLKE